MKAMKAKRNIAMTPSNSWASRATLRLARKIADVTLKPPNEPEIVMYGPTDRERSHMPATSVGAGLSRERRYEIAIATKTVTRTPNGHMGGFYGVGGQRERRSISRPPL